MTSALDRRRFLKSALGAGAAAALPASLAAARAGDKPEETASAGANGAARPFRFVHLTDLHIQPEKGAVEGISKALAAAHKLDPAPEFILFGGDLIMDALKVPEARAREEFGLFKQVLSDHTNLPYHLCIGNHDVFAWGAESVTADHESYGKAMAAQELGLKQTYYAFDHGGWRFYVLDTIQESPTKSPRAYFGAIDQTQRKWLEEDLAAKPAETPALILTHIPIVTVTIFNSWAHRFANNIYMVPTAAICADAGGLADLFAAHNVKLNLSGHIHYLDDVKFRGVNYICGGAVSGNWWKGPLEGVQEGFGVVDLRPDGTFDYRYVDYGWSERG